MAMPSRIRACRSNVRGHEPDPRGEARWPVESQEPVGLARDRGCRYGVDALQSPQCVAYRLSPGVSLSPGLRL